jgi:hypothetical protein
MPRMANGRDRVEIPSTIERADAHARRLWKKAHDSAVETYGEGGAQRIQPDEASRAHIHVAHDRGQAPRAKQIESVAATPFGSPISPCRRQRTMTALY